MIDEKYSPVWYLFMADDTLWSMIVGDGGWWLMTIKLWLMMMDDDGLWLDIIDNDWLWLIMISNGWWFMMKRIMMMLLMMTLMMILLLMTTPSPWCWRCCFDQSINGCTRTYCNGRSCCMMFRRMFNGLWCFVMSTNDDWKQSSRKESLFKGAC